MLGILLLSNCNCKLSQISFFFFFEKKYILEHAKLSSSKIAFRATAILVSDPRRPGTPSWEPLR